MLWNFFYFLTEGSPHTYLELLQERRGGFERKCLCQEYCLYALNSDQFTWIKSRTLHHFSHDRKILFWIRLKLWKVLFFLSNQETCIKVIILKSINWSFFNDNKIIEIWRIPKPFTFKIRSLYMGFAWVKLQRINIIVETIEKCIENNIIIFQKTVSLLRYSCYFLCCCYCCFSSI